MWTFDAFPSAQVAAKHGFGPDQAWLDRVRAASVRLTSGCSASVVSPQGLVLTNWHCVTGCVQALSSPESDLQKNGFVAASQPEERICPAVKAEIVTRIEDVTARVSKAIEGKPPAEVAAARDAESAAIASEACGDDPKARCRVVSLHQGGAYSLYVHRVHDEVRLVMAPDYAAGFFGGDPDNFNFPRFNWDAAFLRLYEDGKPAETPAFLPWRAEPLAEGDLVFVSGSPGSTNRLFTASQMAFLRDREIPIRQMLRAELRGRLIAFSATGAEAERTAKTPLFGIENAFKSNHGRMLALSDATFFGGIVEAERRLRERVAADPALAAEIGDPWAEMEATVAARRELFLAWNMLEAQTGGGSQLYGWARTLVRAAAERPKPEGERLPAFADQNLRQMEASVTAERPIHPAVETLQLGFWLSKAREHLTVDDARVRRLLGAESPEALAKRAVEGSRLADPAVRKALWDGGAAAIAASDDPLIVLARAAEADSYALALAWRERVEGPSTLAAAKIARARFALDGASVYPDATGSLRLSYGTVRGWSEPGREIAPFTTIAGLYDRATGAEPFALDPRWADAKGRLDLSVPFNVATDNDIIGGNSGSPLIDADGRVAGAVFDGNIHSLGGAYAFDARVNRAVSVTSAAILEGLRKVYGADRIADEIEGAATR